MPSPSKQDQLHSCTLLPDLSTGIWDWAKRDALAASEHEAGLRPLLKDVLLSRGSLGEAVAVRLARKLSRRDISRELLEPLFTQILKEHPYIVHQIASDLRAIVERDPASHSPLEPLLFFKGFQAISTYRIAHALWMQDRKLMALQLQSLSSEVFAVDIHPAANIGCGILLDHGTSCVIGETAIVENNVSILHEVTLGGTGKEWGARHPIVRSGVLIGAGAKILGRVTIGECAKIAACSVVLTDIPAHKTAAGIPAVIIGGCQENIPAEAMNQWIGQA